MKEIEDRYFNLKSLADYADVAVPTLRDWIKAGMPASKPQGTILVKQSEFDKWVEGHRIQSEEDLNQTVNDVINNLKGQERIDSP